MNKLLISAAAIALLSGSAIAADLPTYEAAPVMAPVSTAYNWTGFYAGVATGYTWGDADGSGAGSDDFNADGWQLGGFVGYNFALSQFILGAEGDLEWTNIDGDGAGDTELDLNWQGSVRARAGVAFEQFLFFGTAGLAFADFDGDATVAAGGNDDGTELGWTVGAGLDYAVTDNVFLRGEYRYSNFGEVVSNGGEDLEYDSHAIRIGAAFKF